MNRFNKLFETLSDDRKFVVERLREIQQVLRDIAVQHHDDDLLAEPCDVRLCIDFTSEGVAVWRLNFGDVAFDTHHSEICAADVVTADDTEADLERCADELIRVALNDACEIDDVNAGGEA